MEPAPARNRVPHEADLATAIIVRDTPCLVDFGPGVVRRAIQLGKEG